MGRRLSPEVAGAAVHIAQRVVGIQLRSMKRNDVDRLSLWLWKHGHEAIGDAVYRVLQAMPAPRRMRRAR